MLLGVGGYYLGLVHSAIRSTAEIEPPPTRKRPTRTTSPLLLAYFFGVIGFPIGTWGSPTIRSRACSAGRSSLREKEGEGMGSLLRAVHRPQGLSACSIPGRHRRVLLRRRPQRDADPHRAAAPRVPPSSAISTSTFLAGRNARHDDDGDDDLGDPRPVRQLLRADHDRAAPGGWPLLRIEGTHLLAAHGGRLHPHLNGVLRWLPDRLDRLRAAQRPGSHGDGLLHRVLRPGGDLDVPAGTEHDGHDHHDAGTRTHLVASADLRLGGVSEPRS